MLCAEDPHAIKLVDFGLSLKVPQNPDGSLQETLFKGFAGSKSYMAPEIFKEGAGYLGPPVDVWSLGVTIFALVAGFFPLDEAGTSDKRFERLKKDQRRGVGSCDSIHAFYGRACPFTRLLKQLLDAMLMIDPTQRITMAHVVAHDWFLRDDDGVVVT